MQPKVSVVVPIYGVEKYLNQCVDSILAQTLKDIEIILVDDGSKDKCPQIVDEYAKKDKRIKVIHKENSGYGASMNVGLRAATGEYIGIVEPDDWIEPEMYEKLYGIAQQFQSDVVKSGFMHYKDLAKKTVFQDKWSDEIPTGRSFTVYENADLLTIHPSIWSAIYQADFLRKNQITFVEAPGSAWTDNPFFMQTMCLAKKINYTPKDYYYWRETTKTDSEALKNYLWPFDRCQEIDAWLKQQKITTRKIWEMFCLREFMYVKLVLRMKNIANTKDCIQRISEMFAKMDERIIMESKQIPQEMKNMYLNFIKSPILSFYQYRYNLFPKSIIETIFSLKNSRDKRHKVLTLCGLKLKVKR